MSLADRINTIRSLAKQGKSDVEIATATGLEIGDVATVLAMGMPGAEMASSSGRRTIACPFAYNTPNLLTGHTVYTPTVGDILYDAWVEIDTAWNGTTPQGDFGIFTPAHHIGLFSYISAFIGGTQGGVAMSANGGINDTGFFGASGVTRLSTADALAQAATIMAAAQINAVPTPGPVGLVVWASSNPTLSGGESFLPTKLTAPIKVCVSQDATTIGADPGATQGAAVLYLDIDTPVVA